MAWHYWPREGLLNACLDARLPPDLADERLIAAWEGIDPHQFRDGHVHLVGLGDGDTGAWVNPHMSRSAVSLQHAQFRLYLNASCVDSSQGKVDQDYVRRLASLADQLPEGARLMLLAFDYHYTADGTVDRANSTFYLPNQRAAEVAMGHPERFEWIASIHPYREDALETLAQAVANGARAVKWLPPAQGMDPASPRCDAFYAAMRSYDLPLLSHGGDEHAVEGKEFQRLGNPLRLRRALEHGVRVIVAHCASQGQGEDLDAGSKPKLMHNFDLFARMMDEPEWNGRLFGDISAMVQVNRMGRPLRTLLGRPDWHGRLVNGSDYPLPGVMPLISLQALADFGYLKADLLPFLARLRRHNPLLFDFVCKRYLRYRGQGFSAMAFETRRVFERPDTATG